MVNELRAIVLPANQRRTLEELTEDLDLRQGDVRAKQSAFWTMLTLAANTALVLLLHVWTERVQTIATQWVQDVPGAEVSGVDFESGTFRIDVRTTDELPPIDTLLEALDGVVLGEFPVVIDTTYGSVIEVGTTSRC